MGWSSGSFLMGQIIKSCNEVEIEDDKRYKLYKKIIEDFKNEDCDTLCECKGIDRMFDLAYDDESD
jgi:hypothetical protein